MDHVLNRKWFLVFLCLSIAISACYFTGCSRGGGHDIAQTPDDAKSGAFIDSTIEGMQYSTLTWSGYTDSRGGFYYQKGEKVKFYIGGIYFGKVTATGLMTPLTMTGLDELTSDDTNAINMSRILLTLDQDQNPANGITIPRQLCQDLAGVTLDLTDPNLVLDNNPEVNEMLEIMTGSDVTAEEQEDLLVSSADAQIHLENTINSITAEAEDIQETLENMTPVASISSPSGNVIMVQGQSLSFQGSVFGGKSPYKFSWILPDGTSYQQQSPGSRVFNTLGNSYAAMTATDSTGKKGESQRFITVLEASTQEGTNFALDSIPSVQKLNARSSNGFSAGTTVYIDAIVYNGDVPLLYNWILGGVPGNSFVPGTEQVKCIAPRTYLITQGILFSTPGTYTVKLNVKDTNTDNRYPDSHCDGIPVTIN
jgi:hypothetical protein